MSQTREREHPVGYADAALGWQPSEPGEIGLVLYRYTYALAIAADIPKAARGMYLDFGCGTGFGTEIVAAHFERSFGVDRRLECLEYAERHHGRAGTVYCSGLPNPDGHYDFVTMLEVIEHLEVEEARALVRILSSRIAPHGVLHITTPVARRKDGSNPDNHYHVHEYQPGELREILLERFSQVKISPFGMFFHAVCKEPKGI